MIKRLCLVFTLAAAIVLGGLAIESAAQNTNNNMGNMNMSGNMGRRHRHRRRHRRHRRRIGNTNS